MSTMMRYHVQAMNLVAEALAGVERGDIDEERKLELFSQALEWKQKSIAELDKIQSDVTTYATMHQGAANIALECREYALAELFAAKSLARGPGRELANQLKDTIAKADHERNLRSIADSLEQDEVKMNLHGRNLVKGRIAYAEFSKRMEAVESLFKQVIEIPSRQYTLQISPPTIGSFAVNVNLAHSSVMPGSFEKLDPISAYMDKFMENVRLMDGVTTLTLREKFKDTKKREQFLEIARTIAPDGRNISHIGFARAHVDAKERSVSFQTPAVRLPSLSDISEMLVPKERIIYGRLLYADGRFEDSNQIRIINCNGTYNVTLRETGQLNDIVEEMWAGEVRVVATQLDQDMKLDKITLVQPRMIK